MRERDSFPIGLLLGALFPVIGYLCLDFIVGMLVDQGTIAGLSGSAFDKRMRTVLLIAICFNLIPFTIAQKNRYDNTMRGIVFPTLVYVGYWIYKYYDTLFV